jgi:glycosyltransferase involved in cell wall biosynthesis
LICAGENGQLASSAEEFARCLLEWSQAPARIAEMRANARESAQRFSWDAVWEDVYRRYEICFPSSNGTGLLGEPVVLPQNFHQLVPG